MPLSIHTFQQFEIPTLESRYEAARSNPDVSETTRLACAAELIWALQERLRQLDAA